MSRFVFRMLLLLDAPNTIDSIFFLLQTYSMASRGSIAPEAKTDIATGLNLRLHRNGHAAANRHGALHRSDRWRGYRMEPVESTARRAERSNTRPRRS